jgi:DsbC/DsbD-like thiol-disulfide interchange protein
MLKTFLVIGLFLAAVSAEAEASGSVPRDRPTARLFQATTSDGAWTAGLEITLAEDWKTYWRVPGESGIPPQFDWSGSTNLKSVAIGWPAPRRFRDAAGETIGYSNRIVFPLRPEPVDASKPIGLALSLFYGVCKDVCIPAAADLELRLSLASSPNAVDQALLESFAARIPLSADESLLPRIAALRLRQQAVGSVLEIALTTPLPAQTTDVFVEGFPKAHFRAPVAAEPGTKSSIFHLKIDGLDSADELRGKELLVTVVHGPASLVQSLRVE